MAMKNFYRIALLFIIFHYSNYSQAQLIDPNSLFSVDSLTTQINNPSADTVILMEMGGPTLGFNVTGFDWFHTIPTISCIYVRQYQHTFDVSNDSTMTQEVAKKRNDTTVAILAKVIDHYKNQGKVVAVMGHSFGAFTITRYIDYYGTNNVDKCVILSGRLIMDTIPIYGLQNNISYNYNSGINPQLNALPFAPIKSMARLAAEVAIPIYLDSLSGVDLTKVFYEFGTFDGNVGRLMPNEVNFLTAANATVLEIPNGPHTIPDSLIYLNQILEFIRDPSSLSLEEKMESTMSAFFNSSLKVLQLHADSEGELSIYSLSGQLLLKTDYPKGKTSIQLPIFNNGIYLINMTDKNGSFSKRIFVSSN